MGYKLSLKVSDKGALSIYGLGRFPVTLYADQWDVILAKCDAIKAFLAANRANMKPKPEGNGGPAGATAI